MKRLISWAGAILILVIIFGTVYAGLQQSLRLNANDPQIQIAEDVARNLNAGKTPASQMPEPINLAFSLAPFVTIYDKQGKVVITNGYLDGQAPVIPTGVLTSAAGKEYNAVTWQPQTKVRIAAVSVAADSYYVVSGRSLKEVEKRENEIIKVVGAGWLASTVIVTLLALVRSSPTLPAKKHPRIKGHPHSTQPL
ncbi:MAG TPA: hypothetical protein VLI54_02620 [Bacillota bacterium]|nr:hypothetical protein [Bacillota bacterium]